jgi:CRP-like cAMP-binding protein
VWFANVRRAVGAAPRATHHPLMTMETSPVGNRLLDRLPAADLRRLLAAATSVEFVFAQTLHVAGQPIAAVWFPTRGFISLIMPVDSHVGVEVGLVGREGMFGLPLALGVARTPMRAVVQGAGAAIVLGAAAFRIQLASGRALRSAMERYAVIQLRQLCQNVGCTRFHLVEARLARWLLMSQDRSDGRTFRITHEFLGNMLGVRRAGVTMAAGALQRRGFIHYRRGSLTILDRRGLKAAACGCYAADRATYDDILPAARIARPSA